jgi:hypothetical protein
MRVFVGLAAALAAILAADGAAEPAATRVFDRTVVCTTKVVAGARVVTVWISPTSTGATPREGNLGVTPGPPSAVYTGVHVGMFASAETYRGAFYDRKRCAATRAKAPLTRRGLPGPPLGYPADAICPAPKRVLVHLHYVYVAGRHAPGFAVGGKLVAASLGVRAAGSGKPIAFGTLENGARRARLFSAAACETRASTT